MKNAWIYAILIWVCSVLTGSFFTTLYMDLGEGDMFNSIFESYLFIILVSGLNSIPTAIIFCVALELSAMVKFSGKNRFIVICSTAYILCFLTLFLFFFRMNDVPASLADPFFWVVFVFYSMGLTSGIFLFSKWFILNHKKVTY